LNKRKLSQSLVMTITQRIAAVLSAFIVALLAVGVFGINALTQSNSRFDYLATNTLPSIADLDKAIAKQTAIRVNLLILLALQNDTAGKQTAKQNVDAGLKGLDDALVIYDKEDNSDSHDHELTVANQRAAAEYRTAIDEIYRQIDSNNHGAADLVLSPGSSLHRVTDTLTKGLEEQIAYNVHLGDELHEQNQSSFSRTLWIQIALIIASIGAAGALGIFTLLYVRRSLDGIRGTLERSSQALDLTERAPTQRMDEIGRTATAYNGLVGRVSGVLADVRSASESVSVSTSEIAAGNLDLSARTEEQAASLAQTASSMNELTVTVKHNADNARLANSLASNANTVVEEGHQVVEHMMATMTDISESSHRIADITSLIESIAFQTNILALNAAVEAARAGDSGRGFAVVAAEVRTLAQRSSVAAKEIKELIDSSVAKVDSGSEQAGKVNVSMSSVRDAIRRVTDVIGEIAIASEEQSRGIEQVNLAVTQMDEVTQQNAALVEEASAAAQSLNEQASRLQQSVGAFTLNGSTARVSDVSVPSPARSAVTAAATVRKSVFRPRPSVKPASSKVAEAVALAGTNDEWNTF